MKTTTDAAGYPEFMSNAGLDIFRPCQTFFAGKTGLEIGGPSGVFFRGGLFPVYTVAARIDNCNFSQATVWVNFGAGEASYRVDENCAPGAQYVAEGGELGFIPSASHDFVLSSHTLEHMANPLRAISEWMRVVKDQGALALVFPHKEGTFDHRRPVTTLEHLIDDLQQQTTEADLTHLDEILALHDLALDPQAGDPAAFKLRSLKNIENRCLHQHVFDMRLAIQVVHHMGLQIHAVAGALPYHIFVIAEKLKTGQKPDNGWYMAPRAACQLDSPFVLDRSSCAAPRPAM